MNLPDIPIRSEEAAWVISMPSVYAIEARLGRDLEPEEIDRLKAQFKAAWRANGTVGIIDAYEKAKAELLAKG